MFCFGLVLLFRAVHVPMEVLKLGVELELQLLAYTTATATWDPNSSATSTTAHSNTGSLDPLSEARNRTHILVILVGLISTAQ